MSSFTTDETGLLRAFYADFAPAQAEAIRRALDMIAGQRRQRRERRERREEQTEQVGREGREGHTP